MKRILVANIFGIGDVLFTTPLISNLKKEINGVSIDYLCNARTKAVIETNPGIDEIFVYEKDDYLKLWAGSKPRFFSTLSGFFRDIRRKHYDAVFDFTLSRAFGFFFMAAGIPKRIGLDYKKRGVFLTHKQELTGFEGRHVVEYYLDLLKYTGINASVREMRIVLNDNVREWARTYLKDKGAREGRLIALIPGGGASWGRHASRKRWSADSFARVASALAGGSHKVALLGDSSERDLCNEVAGKMAGKPLFVKSGLGLKEYMALLSVAGLVVCNDGGPLHLAAALGVKTVSIFGPVDEKVYGPYPVSERHAVMTGQEAGCRPCYNRFKLPECGYESKCLTGIAPKKVIDACLELLGKS